MRHKHKIVNKFFKLENSLNYKFKNIDLLKNALSHPSLKQVDNLEGNYERLEFLGDSILGFLTTEMIFNKFTDCTEGILAKIKASAVSRDVIVKVANTINLTDYIMMSRGEENCGGRTNINNIENCMEAILAAIYLDSDINQVHKIVNILWSQHIENINFHESDPKTSLQEMLQSKGFLAPTYEVVNQEGLVHNPIFTVKVTAGTHSNTGMGKSIKEAEKNAAKKVLKTLVKK